MTTKAIPLACIDRTGVLRSALRAAALLSLTLIGLSLAGCQNGEQKLSTAGSDTGGLWSIQVTSSAFKMGAHIPAKFTADGEDISPPLHWEGIPFETKEVVLVVEDPDSSRNLAAVHWLVYSMPANSAGVREGASETGELVQGKNTFGKTGYTGPNPRRDDMHRYYFQVYAVDARLNLASGGSLVTVMDAMKGHVLAKGQLMGTYGGAKK